MAAESPVFELRYDELGSPAHTAISRIVEQRSDGMFRVDDIGIEDVPTLQHILSSAVGQRLPTYFYDRDGNYVCGGSTPTVEERHSRVHAPRQETVEGPYGKSAWLRVPAYNTEIEESAIETTPGHAEGQSPIGKSTLVAYGASIILADSALAYGVSHDSMPATAAWALIACGTVAHALHTMRHSI